MLFSFTVTCLGMCVCGRGEGYVSDGVYLEMRMRREVGGADGGEHGEGGTGTERREGEMGKEREGQMEGEMKTQKYTKMERLRYAS